MTRPEDVVHAHLSDRGPVRIGRYGLDARHAAKLSASSNPVQVGRNPSGQVVALLADPDLLTRSEFA